MRVAIDSGPLTGGHSVRGVGASTKGLIESLKKYNDDKEVKIDPVDFSTTDPTKYDILHYTAFNPYFPNLPSIGNIKAKTILTIHDLIPLIYKKQYPLGIKGGIRYQINRYLVKRANAIITVSETSKKDIVRFIGVKPDKVNVVYWAVDEAYRSKDNVSKEDWDKLRKLYKLPDKFVLYVGDVNYNKNLPTLITACGKVNIPLVIVGKQAGNLDEMTESWKNLKGPMDIVRSLLNIPHPELAHFTKLAGLVKKENVILTDYVPTSDLAKIFRMASVYCQPSLYEGFGIPVLEAFASGVPVVISKTQALVEIAGKAALSANPNDANDFANKISSLLKDTTERLHYIRAGISREKEFSWEETAKKTIEVYKKVTGT